MEYSCVWTDIDFIYLRKLSLLSMLNFHEDQKVILHIVVQSIRTKLLSCIQVNTISINLNHCKFHKLFSCFRLRNCDSTWRYSLCCYRITNRCNSRWEIQCKDYTWWGSHTSRTICGVFLSSCFCTLCNKSSIQWHNISLLLHILHIQKHHEVLKPSTVNYKYTQSQTSLLSS